MSRGCLLGKGCTGGRPCLSFRASVHIRHLTLDRSAFPSGHSSSFVGPESAPPPPWALRTSGPPGSTSKCWRLFTSSSLFAMEILAHRLLNPRVGLGPHLMGWTLAGGTECRVGVGVVCGMDSRKD